MKHYTRTNLLKGFLTQTIAACLILTSCSNNPSGTTNCPLTGKWSIVDLQTKESILLEGEAGTIYHNEISKMLDSSALSINPDSTYTLLMGPDREAGKWNWDSKDSLLLLEPITGKKSYFKAQANGNESFILKKDLDPRELKLTIRRHLPH